MRNLPPRLWALGGAAFSVLFFAGASLGAAADPPHSESVSVKQDLRTKRENLKSVQRRLEREKQMRQAAERRERNVLARLDSTDRQLERLNREKRANEGDLDSTLQRIGLLESLEKQTGLELEERRLSLSRRLRALQRARESDPLFSVALGIHRTGDFSRRIRFGVLLARSNQRLMERMEEERRRLEETSAHLTGEKIRRVRILSALDQQRKRATREKNSRSSLLKSIQGEKAVREAAIRDLNAAADNLSSKVGELLRQEEDADRKEQAARQAEADRRRNEETAAAASHAVENTVSAEPQGQLAPPLVGGGGLRRGLPWPVAGTVIQPFGKTKRREFNATVESAGLQIQAPHGAPVRAVAAGRVRYADWFQGYGKLVILDHGRGYYSLYAQASDLKVSPGDTVSAGQVIASVGDTGSLVGDSLYFEVRKDGLPRNPLAFLRSKH